MKVIINNGENKIIYPMINHEEFIKGSKILYHSQWLDEDDQIIYSIDNTLYYFTSWDAYFHSIENKFHVDYDYIVNIKQNKYTEFFPPYLPDNYIYSDKGHFEKLPEKTDFIVYYYPTRWELSFYNTRVNTIKDVNNIKNIITKLIESDDTITFNKNDTVNVSLITVSKDHYGRIEMINKLLNILEELCDNYWDNVISFTEMAETLEFIKNTRDMINS